MEASTLQNRLQEFLPISLKGELGPVDAEIWMIDNVKMAFLCGEFFRAGQEVQGELTIIHGEPAISLLIHVTGPPKTQEARYKDGYFLKAAYLVGNPKDRRRLDGHLSGLRGSNPPSADGTASRSGPSHDSVTATSSSGRYNRPPPSITPTSTISSARSLPPPSAASQRPAGNLSDQARASDHLLMPMVSQGKTPILYARVGSLELLRSMVVLAGNDILCYLGDPGGIGMGAAVQFLIETPSHAHLQMRADIASCNAGKIVLAVRNAPQADRQFLRSLLESESL